MGETARRMATFGWLHLTDFHQGMDRLGGLWPNVEEQFFEDLRRLHDRAGPWDAVLFTGDLTQRAAPAEFERLGETLDRLWEELAALGSDPVLLAVPGNHDLARPDPRLPTAEVLRDWATKQHVQDSFWRDASGPYRGLVEEAFAGWRAFWDSHPRAERAGVHHGMLPGDFSAVLEKDGARLGVVGLNSAFLQLGDGVSKGQLALSVDQLHAATGTRAPDWIRQQDAAILMTHHAPDWFDQHSQQVLNGEISPPGRFAVHLFGHMHEGAVATTSVGGAAPWRRWQGVSLFGLEGWGPGSERRHGYSAGRLTIPEGAGVERGEIRCWPRVGQRHQAGFWRIVPDQSCVLLDDQGIAAEPVTLTRLRPRAPRPAASRPPVAQAGSTSPALNDAELAQRFRDRAGVVASRLTPVPLAPDLDAWLDYVLRDLSGKIPIAVDIDPHNRLFSLLYALGDGVRALHDEGRRLVVVVDPVERFSGAHQERLVRLLQVVAQLAEDRTGDAALEALGVAVAGGEELQRILTGQVGFSAELSPFRASHITALDPVRAPPGASAGIRAVLDAVGGHPELTLWAVGRGGLTDGHPEDELATLRTQVERLSRPPHRASLERLLDGDPVAWRDPDAAVKWSGWIRIGGEPGWLGPVLEGVARRAVGR